MFRAIYWGIKKAFPQINVIRYDFGLSILQVNLNKTENDSNCGLLMIFCFALL